MADLTLETITRAGLTPALPAADVGGDSFVNTGKEFLYIDNASGGVLTVTLDIQQTVDSQAVIDRTVTIPDGAFKLIGPFPTNIYNDAAKKVNVTYSTVVGVKVSVITI